MKYARRKDANQDALARFMGAMGAWVLDTHATAGAVPGFPDLMVFRGTSFWWCEVKNPGKYTLTPAEAAFHLAARAHGRPVHILQTEDDCSAMLGAKFHGERR